MNLVPKFFGRSRVLSMFFASASASWLDSIYLRQLQNAPTMNEKMHATAHNLIRYCGRRRARVNKAGIAATVLAGAFYAGMAELVSRGGSPHERATAFGVALVATYATEIAILLHLSERTAMLNCAMYFCATAIRLEAFPEKWNDPDRRLSLARQLEKAARALEKVPLRYTRISREHKIALLQIGRAKAAGVRELQLWLIKPGDFTFTDLVARLNQDLFTIMDHRWFDLPDGVATPQRTSMRHRLMLLSAATLGFGAMALTIAFSNKIGLTAPFLTTAFGVLGVAFLNRAGLGPGDLSQYLDAEKRISGTPK